MSDLTDLEICKKIAEIEGVKIEIVGDHTVEMITPFHQRIYNPLTDDALCFQLLKKYRLEIETSPTHFQAYFTVSRGVTDTSLNKAICLAIIEANSNE